MAAEMTRLPTFNDLRVGALAENGIERTQEREIHQILFHRWTRVTATTSREGIDPRFS